MKKNTDEKSLFVLCADRATLKLEALRNRNKMAALVDYGSSGSDEEENVVDLPVNSKDQRTLISVLSKQMKDVKDSSTKKRGVRIGLPSLHSKVCLGSVCLADLAL